jgi:hypothetical protein
MGSERGSLSDTGVVCPKCGYNLTGATIGGYCPECGTPVEHALRVRPIGPALPRVGYTVPVLLTILFCVIGGIVAVVYTSKANTAAELGDVAQYKSAKSTRNGWMIASLLVGLIILGIQIGPLIAGA